MDLSSIYEKLGAFYLGKSFDVAAGELAEEELVLYDSKDLCTHAVIVGMTGSGKTGLGVGLIEEAAIDGIPSLVIDPKGDLTNLMLNYPDLRPEDLAQWISADDASRAGKTVEEFAAEQAGMWKKGIEDWGQTGERIRKLGDATEVNIYTPGSDAGIPISILSSFAVPPAAVLADADMFRDRVSTTATSILTLLGIDADPIQSREHILLTTIFDHCWKNNLSMDLGTLIQMVQTPPVQKIGVMDLESFFNSKDRFSLAMSMNNLLAAPGFSAWMTGEPLDIDRLLYTPSGKPKTSIFYIAHLSETERTFFISLLLNQTLGWMRSRPGTNSLRAMLYIDEIFGLMPPVAEPPTKKPLLTLLKQARAYGLGLVLATQNPVDLDYKGLSNTGTWFLGRLQTDQDKQRVLDGLEGASAEAGSGFNRGEMANILSGVGKRVFLLHNVHESHPVTFHTRWCLSYLAGPMTRTQIKKLMAAKKNVAAAEPAFAAAAPAMPAAVAAPPVAAVETAPPPQRPVLPPDIPQVFLPVRRAHGAEPISYEPRLLALGKLHFVDTRRGLNADEMLSMMMSLDAGAFGIDWEEAVSLEITDDDLDREPMAGGVFGDVPSEAGKSKSYTTWKKQLADHLYRSRRYRLFKAVKLGEISEAGESEREFRIRLSDRAREERDEQIEKLRSKYASKLNTLEERLRKAEQRFEREQQEAAGAKWQSMISTGATILGAVMGRRMISSTNVGRAATAARGVGRARKQADDVDRAREDIDTYTEKLEDMENELASEIEEIEDRFDVDALELDELMLKPRKSDIDIRHLALAWVPFGRDAAGGKVPLYQ
jgi:hypothetical protein